MADPLSVAVSAMTVLATCISCAKTLYGFIEGVRGAPNDLLNLSNEVNTLQAVLAEVSRFKEHNPATPQLNETLGKLLIEANEVLCKLNALALRCESRSQSLDRRVTWLCQKGKAQGLQKRLENVRSNIVVLLIVNNAINSAQLNSAQLSMKIEELQSSCLQLQQQVNGIPGALLENFLLQRNLSETLSGSQHVTIQNSTEEASNSSRPLLAQVAFRESQNVITPFSPISSVHIETEQRGASVISEPVLPQVQNVRFLHQTLPESTISYRMYNNGHCRSCCDCSCHFNRRYQMPVLLKGLLGSLFLRYTGLPMLASNCTNSSCKNHPGRSLHVVYCFPRWFLEKAIYFVAAMTYVGNPVFGLEVRRTIGWGREDNILRFSLTGNTAGVRSLLDDGKASLIDVDQNHGRTALQYAVQLNRIQTCEFLLKVGADPHTPDNYGMSTYQKAWEKIFIRNGSAEVLEALKRLFPESGISETWNFSHLHKLVLGVLPTSLESALESQQYSDQVNSLDFRGRTPLHWAATRGDSSAVGLLLENGADANVQDELDGTPLIFAASSGSVRTLELLLLAGANVHLTDIRGGQALHYACRHQNNVEPVKLLLQAQASIDCKNVYGHTPLVGAAITNRFEIGAYLLARGADMQQGGANNDSPLFQSCFHNSHEFLRMLLEKGAEYTGVNKAGSTLLHAAALEADLETIEILRSAGLRNLAVDLVDKHGKTALDIVTERVASPNGFKEAFERLLESLREGGE